MIRLIQRGVCVAALAALLLLPRFELPAQTMMPIPPHGSTYTGYSRGFWFTAPTDFFIEGIRIPQDASSTGTQNAFLVRLNAPPPAYPTTTTSYTVLGQWYNIPGYNILPCQILVNTGDVIGIIGHRGTLPATNFNAINSYGTGLYPSNVLGYPCTLNRFLYQDNILNIVPGGLTSESGGSIGRVEMYVGPPCVIPDGALDVSIVDAYGQPTSVTEVPGTIYAKYVVRYPAGASNVGITLEFRPINDPTGPPVFSVNFNVTKQAGIDLMGTQMITLPPTFAPGYYLVKPIVNSKNSCDVYQDSELAEDLLLAIPPGTTLCRVWPGDVNDDGIVNYGDRHDLNTYIHDASLRSSWLEGPARYRHDAATNPLTFIEWVEQPGIPWQTPEGCYMDTDGNGVINNFDYIAIKLNWLREHGGIAPRGGATLSAITFGLNQNFPNPFNPGTMLEYSVPESSHVRMVVTDMLGRTVATLVDETKETGVHGVAFDGAGFPSGQYFATITMTGLQSALSYSKTIKMTLSK